MNWWPDTTLYDICCGERPCVYKGGRIIYGKMDPCTSLSAINVGLRPVPPTLLIV